MSKPEHETAPWGWYTEHTGNNNIETSVLPGLRKPEAHHSVPIGVEFIFHLARPLAMLGKEVDIHGVTLIRQPSI